MSRLESPDTTHCLHSNEFRFDRIIQRKSAMGNPDVSTTKQPNDKPMYFIWIHHHQNPTDLLPFNVIFVCAMRMKWTDWLLPHHIFAIDLRSLNDFCVVVFFVLWLVSYVHQSMYLSNHVRQSYIYLLWTLTIATVGQASNSQHLINVC